MTPKSTLTKQTPSYRIVLITVVVALLAFFTWAILSEIDLHVRGYGRIIPSGNAKVIQHLEGGIVTEIFVKEGQKVDDGTPLFQINNTRALSEQKESQISKAALEARLIRLEAERNDANNLNFPAPLLEQIPSILLNEQDIFETRRRRFAEEANVLTEQARQKALKLEDLKSQLSNVTEEYDIAKRQLEINEKLKKSGAVSETKYLNSKSAVKNFETRLSSIRKQIPVAAAALEEVRNKSGGLEEKKMGDILKEMNETRVDIQKLQERLKSFGDRVERTEILSPARGVINSIYVTTVGGVIRPGEPLAELIPLDDTLIVEAQVPSKDRGQIWNGQDVLIKITAYDFARFGGIQGTVQDISADSIQDPQGGFNYRVKIAIESGSIPENMTLFPGMTADVDILTGKTTIMNYLLKPLRRISGNAFQS